MSSKETRALGLSANIIQDIHKTLSCLRNLPFFQMMNYSLHFVDPETHAHTQNIENMLIGINKEKKHQMGQHTSLLATHLEEFMWRRKY